MTGQETLQQMMNLDGQDAINVRDFAFAIIGSLASSIVAMLLYGQSYGRNQLGASVQRMFLLGGPSITAVLLGIQFSLPLSLGLLGALSIIRFRTPVKDPAEIGFLLLVVAGAIGCATFNPWLVVILYLVAILVVGAQILFERYFGEQNYGYLVVELRGEGALLKQEEITRFVKKKAKRARLESVSTLQSAPTLHYRFNRSKDADWGRFKSELDAVLQPATVEIYVT